MGELLAEDAPVGLDHDGEGADGEVGVGVLGGGGDDLGRVLEVDDVNFPVIDIHLDLSFIVEVADPAFDGSHPFGNSLGFP